MTIWEYHVETINLEFGKDEEWNIKNSPHGEIKLLSRLNEFGKFGWNLVSILPVLNEQGGTSIPLAVYVVFKKPKV